MEKQSLKEVPTIKEESATDIKEEPAIELIDFQSFDLEEDQGTEIKTEVADCKWQIFEIQVLDPSSSEFSDQIHFECKSPIKEEYEAENQDFLYTQSSSPESISDRPVKSSKIASNRKTSQTKWKCEQCHETFLSRSQFTQHCLDIHSSPERKCSLCPEMFRDQPLLDNHLVTDHKFVKCHICPKTLNTEKALEAHITRVHKLISDKPSGSERAQFSKCEFCPKIFTSKKYLTNHCLEKHVTEKIRCQVCYATLDDPAMRDTHIASSHVKCEMCSKYYIDEESLENHLLELHHFECKHCGTVFTTKEAKHQHCLKEHLKLYKTCRICKKPLANWEMLGLHLSTEHNYVQCKECSKFYESKKSLRNHFREKHGIKCEHCDGVFATRKQLHQHYSEFHKIYERKCHLCGLILDNQEIWDSHVETQHNFVQCEICSMLLSDQPALHLHMRRIHPVKVEHPGKTFPSRKYKKAMPTIKFNPLLKCELCDEYFPEKYILVRHYVENHGPEEVRCDVCSEILENQESLTKHKATTHIYPKCIICNRFYANQKSLSIHVRKCHPLSCEICGKDFDSRENLAQHYADVHRTSYKECLVCKEHLRNEDSLNSHMVAVHAYVQCEICGKPYTNTIALQQHIYRYHPLKCSHCDEVFPSRKKLNRHCSETHENMNREQCSVCKAVFQNQAYLDRHMDITHNYVQCEVCKKFLPNIKIMDHMATKHPSNWELCKEEFPTKELLSEHFFGKNQPQERKCSVCEEVLENQGMFETHMTTKHEFIKCGICPSSKLFPTRTKFRDHMRETHRIKCQHCAALFTTKTSWSQHCSKKHPNKKQICFVCEDSLENQSRLEQHLSTAHAKCTECDNFYTNQGLLEVHMTRIHCLKCKKCGDIFNSRELLNKHRLEKHETCVKKCTGKKCSVCNEEFGNQEKLYSHLVLKHNYFQCEICAKSFEQLENLNRHIYMSKDHSSEGAKKHKLNKDRGSKPGGSKIRKVEGSEEDHECDECSLVFESLPELEYHKKNHEGLVGFAGDS